MSFSGKEGLGVFEFTDDGFYIHLKGDKKRVSWNEIERLETYKRDLLTIDQVCLDIVLAEKVISISEDTDGFRIFVDMLQKQFPSIEKNWDWKITQPPFATNHTILYQRK